MALLAGAIQAGTAHLTGTDGAPPRRPAAWGWRLKVYGAGENLGGEWQPQGAWIGWLEGDDIFLEPEAAYAAAQKLGHANGTPVPVQPKTLHKRLRSAGLLVSTEVEAGRGLTVRRCYAGERRHYLHLRRQALIVDEPDQSDHQEGKGADPAELLGPKGPVGPIFREEVATGKKGVEVVVSGRGADSAREKAKVVINPTPKDLPGHHAFMQHTTADAESEPNADWESWEESL